MKTIMTALRMLLTLTLLTGIAYPLLVLLAGQTLFPYQAGGSLIWRDGAVVGSDLLAQSFSGERYFHPRPSASGYTTPPSGGSNLSPTSKKLLAAVAERRAQGAKNEMLFTSGSGLDPDISPESALAQIPRILGVRSQTHKKLENNKQDLENLVRELTQEPDLGFLGQKRVNVLRLNLALDTLDSIEVIGEMARRNGNTTGY